MDSEAVANLPPWLRDLIKKVNLADMTKAITNVTLADFKHLIDTAKSRELNADPSRSCSMKPGSCLEQGLFLPLPLS